MTVPEFMIENRRIRQRGVTFITLSEGKITYSAFSLCPIYIGDLPLSRCNMNSNPNSFLQQGHNYFKAWFRTHESTEE